jgi:phosphopantetheinyl transferase (holo-ACP synthase)
MIGNDIVDLKLAAIQSNWRRKGFLNKIFTEEEQRYILSSENSFQLVWLFWSMKESAYKIYMRKHKNRFFAPKKFNCTMVSKNEGTVLIEQERYTTSSTINNDYIFTHATQENYVNVNSNYFEVENETHSNHSQIVYKKLKETVSKKLRIPVAELQLKKDTLGIPKLYQHKTPIKVSFSISHHGTYGAYSLLNKF